MRAVQTRSQVHYDFPPKMARSKRENNLSCTRLSRLVHFTVAYMRGVNGRLVVRALIGTPKISCIDIKIRLIV